MKTVTLPSGEEVPSLGLGTWRMGESPHHRQSEINAIKLAIDLGVTLIDTAEMYGDGGAEEVIRDAIDGEVQRDELFIVSKVYPHNASLKGAIAACERSLKRLNSDYIDLYLLHWPGSIPLEETLNAFQNLKQQGKIRHYGVSNFDTSEIQDVVSLSGGDAIAANQVLYNLNRRWPEWSLKPWCDERRIPIMAYSPVEQGRLSGRVLQEIAKRHSAAVMQIALAWLLRQDNVITIPKAVQPQHIRDNIAALDIVLRDEDLQELDLAFPAPAVNARLEMN